MQSSPQNSLVKIYLRFYNKKGTTIQLQSKITLQEVVEQIQQKTKIQAYNLIIILKGKVIFNSTNPQSLDSIVNLQNKNIIHILNKKQLIYKDDFILNILIVVKDGLASYNRKFQISLKSQSKIKDVISQIRKKYSYFDQNQLTMLSAGRILDLDKKLSDYYIQNQGEIVFCLNRQVQIVKQRAKQNQFQNQENQKFELQRDLSNNNIASNNQISSQKLSEKQDQKKQQNKSQKFIKFEKFPSLENFNIIQSRKNNQIQEQNINKSKLQKKQKIQTLLASQFQDQFLHPTLNDKSLSERYEDQPASPIEVSYPEYSKINNLSSGDYLLIKGIADDEHKNNLQTYIYEFTRGNLNNLFEQEKVNHVSENSKDYLVPWTIEKIKQNQNK